MLKSLVALATLSAMSVPATAQTTPAQPAPTQNATQPTKPQMVKKRVCEQVDEDPYSRLGNRKICKTIEVPADQANGTQNSQQTPAPTGPGSGN